MASYSSTEVSLVHLPALSQTARYSNILPKCALTPFIVFIEGTSIVITDVVSGDSRRLRSTVDGAVVNPGTSDIIALRCTTNVQVFNLALQSRLCALTTEERVELLSWLDARRLAVVTTTAVYMIDLTDADAVLDSDSVAVKIFDRARELRSFPASSVASDADGRWFALSGGPVTQLYSGYTNSTIVVEGDCACFNVLGDDTVLCLATKGTVSVMRMPEDGSWVCDRVVVSLFPEDGEEREEFEPSVGIFMPRRHDPTCIVVASTGTTHIVDVTAVQLLATVPNILTRGASVLFCCSSNGAPLHGTSSVVVCGTSGAVVRVSVPQRHLAPPPGSRSPVRANNGAPQNNNNSDDILRLAQSIDELRIEQREFRTEVLKRLDEVLETQDMLMNFMRTHLESRK
eukprot:PhM_4_TR8199/c0_g1_i1/m.82077